ncbi:MAG: MFS transporter [Candidatus Zixiibacteriota bacterium]
MNKFLASFDKRLWALAFGWVASSIGFAAAFPYLALYFHSDLGISMTHIGLFFGVAAIIRATFQALGGEIADRYGRYYPMVISQLIRTVTFVIVSLAIFYEWGFFAIGGLIIVNSIFGAMFQPAANATVADIVSKEMRTDGYAIIRIAGNIGWSIGPAVGGFFAENSYAILFLIAAGMTLLSSTIIGFTLRGLRHSNSGNEHFRPRDIFAVKKDRLLLKYIVIVYILYLVVSQFMMPLSLYTVEYNNLSTSQLGLLYGLNGLIVILFQIPTARLARNLRLTFQLSLGAAIYALGYLWCGFATAFWGFIIVIAIITIGENFVSPSALAITANIAPEGRTGRYMGVYGLAVTLGWSMGPMLGGMLMDLAKPNFAYSWGFVSLLAIIAAIGFNRLGKIVPADANYSQNKISK